MRHIIRGLVIASLVGCAMVSRLVASTSEAPVAASAQARDLTAVRALLKTGADVNAAQGDGMTALHWAAMNADVEMTTMLLQAGANVRAQSRLGGYLPLHLAAQAGSAAVVDQLLVRGAPANQPTTTGATPLMLAAASGSAAATSRLITPVPRSMPLNPRRVRRRSCLPPHSPRGRGQDTDRAWRRRFHGDQGHRPRSPDCCSWRRSPATGAASARGWRFWWRGHRTCDVSPRTSAPTSRA